MNEELIAQIVSRVLSDPEVQKLLTKDLSQSTVAVEKPNLLVLLNNAPNLIDLCNQMQKIWSSDYSIKVLGTAVVRRSKLELPVGMEWVTLYDATHNYEWEKVVIPACTANTLAKIALGLRDTPLCEMAAEAIVRGIPVEIYTSNLGFTSKTPVAYKQLYESYLERLRSFGVIVKDSVFSDLEVKESSIGHGSADKNEQSFCDFEEGNNRENCLASDFADEREVVFWRDKLLSEKEAVKLPPNSVLKLDRGVIVTPLAKDALKLRNIEIYQEQVWRYS